MDGPFGGADVGAVDVEEAACDDEALGAEDGAPPRLLPLLSAASLFVLYSILFCSKLGSFKYS